MIDHSRLPTWLEIFRQLGEPEPRRNRSRCPIHNGNSPTSFSVNEDRGLYHCFACGASGDKMNFVQRVQGCDFKAALGFLGIEAEYKSPKPDPEAIRERTALEAIRNWVKSTGRRLRDEFLYRQRISVYGLEKLRADAESLFGWELLRIAYDGEALNEFLLDEIDMCRTNAERITAWRRWRNAIN